MADNNLEKSDFELLQSLLLGDEKEKIKRLEEHLDVPEMRIDDVSSVLPQAINLSISKDNKLSAELMPVIEETIKQSVKRDINVFSDLLYPVMGPAIRKSISETFLQMIQSMNNVIEHSFSWKGLKWRFEAWRTGQSFAEVVLLHSVIYRVEQVFLIHKETGLLLHHTSLADVVQQDSDLISAMLTAIQDFVHDSFNHAHDNEDVGDDTHTQNITKPSLNQISLGEFSIWIEQGPEAVIAAVIKGTAPETLREKLIATLEDIHLQHAQAMQHYSGDETDFSIVDGQLQECLISQYQSTGKKNSWLLWSILLAVIGGIVFWLFIYIQQAQHWKNYVQLLKEEPGIIVTDISSNDEQYIIHGLRDPLAREPDAILSDSQLNKPLVLGPFSIELLKAQQIVYKFEPYQSLTREFIEQRAQVIVHAPDTVKLVFKQGLLSVSGRSSLAWKRQLVKQSAYISGVNQLNVEQLEVTIDLTSLAAPESVSLNYDNGLLTLSGTAPDIWIRKIKKQALSLPGIAKVDMDELVNSDILYLTQLVHDIESESVFFDIGKTNFSNRNNDKKLNRIYKKITALIQQAEYLSKDIIINIQGYSDPIGPFTVRRNISYLRAENMRQFLMSQGISGLILNAQSMVEKNKIPVNISDHNMRFKRRVGFSISIRANNTRD